jgi:hypothetical protein
LSRASAVVCGLLLLAGTVLAQQTEPEKTPETSLETSAASAEVKAEKSADEARVRQELESMRALITQQASLIEELRRRVERLEGDGAKGEVAVTRPSEAGARGGGLASQAPVGGIRTPGEAQKDGRVQELDPETGEVVGRKREAVSFSGDVRMQYDGILNQLNASPNAADPSVLGNELTARNRLRVRARLAVRGEFGEEVFTGAYDASGARQTRAEFDWGLRLATGSMTNVASSNQALTDFFTHKPFALDQAYVAWNPRRAPGLRLQGGKFEVPWLRTEMTVSNLVHPEGLSQTYTRGFKDSKLGELTLVAWQLPMLERNSGFVRNADGTVNFEQSRRAGRDLALYGGQLRATLKPARDTALTLSVADLFFSGTQFISPVQFFGGQVQLPVTFTVPATATSPAQTLTAQVAVPREFLVPGNANLGVSAANVNAVNRDGRLSSGFNLVDLIGRLELNQNPRYPLTLLFNFVTNTQARDVLVAGPGGSDRFLDNNENRGYWAEAQLRRLSRRAEGQDINTPVRGDLLFNYTFIRIEKDAVLTPFNYDDLIPQSDVRAHRLRLAFVADPRVTLRLTALFNNRPNGLLGVFGTTPPGSLGGTTTRIQLDTSYRF